MADTPVAQPANNGIPGAIINPVPGATSIEDGVAKDASGKTLASNVQTPPENAAPQFNFGFGANQPQKFNFNFGSQEAVQQAASKNDEQPSVQKRFGIGLRESLGIPSTDQLKAQTEEDAQHPIREGFRQGTYGPLVDAVTGVASWAKRAGGNIKEGIEEEEQARQNIMEGGPIGQNLGKAAAGIVHGGVGSIPFIGEPIEKAGQNVTEGNYAGAAGQLTGVAAQAALEAISEAKGRYDSANTVHEARLKEVDVAKNQVGEATKRLDQSKQDFADGKTNQANVDAAQTELSRQAANARKAQEAATASLEARKNAGLDISRSERRANEAQAKQDAQAKAKKVATTAAVVEDYKNAFPPTRGRAGAYTNEDLSTALGYLEDQHNQKPLKTVQDHYDALDASVQDIDDKIAPVIEKYGNEPLTFSDGSDVKMRVRDALSESKKNNFMRDGMNRLAEDYDLTDPSLSEASRILTDLNADTRGTLKKNMWDVATALRVDPEFAAKYHAANAIREGIDGTLQDHNINGIRQLRSDQKSLITVRNAVENKVQNGDTTMRGSGQSGEFRKFAARNAEVGGKVIGGGIGVGVGAATFGFPGAWIGERLGEHVGGTLGRTIGEKIAPGDLNRNQLATRAMDLNKGVGRPIVDLSGSGTPSNPPAFEVPPVPGQQMTAEQMRHIQRENTPLHSALASHYNEFTGDVNYGTLEQKFMQDIQEKKAHGVELDGPEKKILTQLNDQDAADRMKQTQEAQQEQLKQQMNPEPELPQATLPIDYEPVLQPQGNIQHGMHAQSMLVHDLAHAVVAKEVMGDQLPSMGIRSHLHPENGNALASAAFDWSKFVDEDGNMDAKKLEKHIDDIATVYVSGGVANDLWHGVPFDKNHHLGADMSAMSGLMSDLNIPKEQQKKIIFNAGQRAMEILNQPGVEDVLHDHASVREPNLPSFMHFSPERIQQVLEDLKGGENAESTKLESSAGSGKSKGNTEQNPTEPGRGGVPGGAKGNLGKQSGEAKPAERQGTGEGAGKEAEAAEVNKPGSPRFDAEQPNLTHKETDKGGEIRLDSEQQGTTKNRGMLKYTKTGEDSYAVTAVNLDKDFQGQGLGQKMYEQAADQARAKGAKYLTSDLGGQTSYDAGKTWDRLQKAHPDEIEKVESKAGSPGYRWNLQPEVQQPANPKFDIEQAKRGLVERTTGDTAADEAIKAGGGVPGGRLGDLDGPHVKMFHDPQTGTTLGFSHTTAVTPEATKAQIDASRAQYAAADNKVKQPENPKFDGNRVSTRLPAGKNATENPLEGEPLVIGREALDKAPLKTQQKFADTIRKYPGVKIPESVKDPKKVMDRFVNHVSDNLKYLYNQVTPEKQVNNAKWYESANKLTKNMADEHGLTHQQAAAVTATQSPQKDWDMNVSLARRITDVYHNHQDTVTSPKMMQKGRDIVEATGANKDLNRVLPSLEGKKFSELTDPYERAAWVRLYDEAHNPRAFHYIDPATGDNKGLRMNADNVTPSKIAWGSLPQIDNALSVLKDGSRENISERLGGQHKVRNFYNNMIDPTNNQDVTIDTHAVAAGLIQPLGGSAKEVLHNFGGAGKNLGTGISGTYPLYADAYRQAAKDLGIKPRELQSVVWEHVREMFPSEWKSPENEKAVKSIWKKYSDGKQTLDKTRQQVLAVSEQAKQGVSDARTETAAKAQAKQTKAAPAPAPEKTVDNPPANEYPGLATLRTGG